MKNYKEIVILTVLFVFLSILIFHYYINVCNTSIEFFNEEKKQTKKIKNNEQIIGEKVLSAKTSILSAARAVGKAINESAGALKEVSKKQ
tara:strand:- start:186 stop:455 length:270 start_codon:yes stop_codon:yes gene_type:complete